LLIVVAAAVSGCSIDRIEWERTGYAVEAATQTLEEEHGLEHPSVECIKREVGGAVWECRTLARHSRFTCKVHAGPREKIHEVHCHAEHEDGEADEDDSGH
jgi:hypothetical protein